MIDIKIFICVSYFVCCIYCDETTLSFNNTIIETIPSSQDNLLVVGLTGLIVEAQFPKGSITMCQWVYDDDDDAGSYQWYSPIEGGCAPTADDKRAISCSEKNISGVIYMLTNLTLYKPLDTDLDISIHCDGQVVLSLPHKTVKECSTGSSEIEANCSSSTCGYLSSATLSCAKNYCGNPIQTYCQTNATFAALPYCKPQESTLYPFKTIIIVVVFFVVGAILSGLVEWLVIRKHKFNEV